MLSNYTFLTDHSYSLQPNADDNDELSLNRREEKNKEHRRSSNRTNKTTLTTNRTVSIDRSSSDKENNLLILSNSTDVPMSATSSSVNINKSSTNTRSNKKKSIGSRLSTRTAMNNSRTQSGKKQDNKTSSKTGGVKSTQGSIIKKKKIINRGKTKPLNISQTDFNDTPLLLSIEERVKLRRTKPLQSSSTIAQIKPEKMNKSQSRTTKTHTIQEDIKQIRQSISKNNSSKKNKIIKPTKTSSVVSTIKNKKFLGSGLDLDNIVLGNRQRRCVQT